MKKLYFLNEEESNRILNLHRKAIKQELLSEAGPYQDTDDIPSTNTTTTNSSTTTTTTSAPTTTTTTTVAPSANQTTTATGNLTQQLQTLVGVKADGKFGPKSLQGLKNKLGGTSTQTTTTTGATPTTGGNTPTQTTGTAPTTGGNTPTQTTGAAPTTGGNVDKGEPSDVN